MPSVLRALLEYAELEFEDQQAVAPTVASERAGSHFATAVR